MKKLAFDSMKLDSIQIVKDDKHRLTVNAVISREGVYDYPEKNGELKKALNPSSATGISGLKFMWAPSK